MRRWLEGGLMGLWAKNIKGRVFLLSIIFLLWLNFLLLRMHRLLSPTLKIIHIFHFKIP